MDAVPSDSVTSNEMGEGIRAVTEDEAASFDANGWVLLRGLVPPATCKALLEQGRPRFSGLFGENAAPALSGKAAVEKMTMANAASDGLLTKASHWAEWRGAVRAAHDPAFSGLALSRAMHRNMQFLLRRDRKLRVFHDILACKLPNQASTRTKWHQDAPNMSLDRNALTIWIALEEIKPEQGPLQFYTGSHRLGLLGLFGSDPEIDLTHEYPELARLSVSPKHHMMPGDCTVHHSMTVHGATANDGADPRWSYIVIYFPDDARYNGMPNHDTDGFGLKVGEPILHPSFTPLL